MSWFFYALATPALYSVTNFIDKFLIEKKIKEPILLTIFGGFTVFVLGICILLIRGFKIFDIKELGIILLAGVFLELYILPYYKALKLDDTSRVVPLFQFIPIFALVLSALFLGETVHLKQLVGILFIVSGGFILSAEKLSGGIFKPRKSLWYMLLSGLLYTMVGIIFRFVVKSKDFWTTLGWEYIGIGIGALILLMLTSKRKQIPYELKRIKSSLPLITINNSLAIVAQISESYAVSLAAVPLVSSVGGTQPLFVLIYGLILTKLFPRFIKEDIRRQVLLIKVVSIVVIFAGLYLIYF
ncbi:EamA family transporter [Candidatus Roizmanbacteria bacterium]|nr:EamA family transporter [Candidatus Roizmanbacteria bacterium]